MILNAALSFWKKIKLTLDNQKNVSGASSISSTSIEKSGQPIDMRRTRAGVRDKKVMKATEGTNRDVRRSLIDLSVAAFCDLATQALNNR